MTGKLSFIKIRYVTFAISAVLIIGMFAFTFIKGGFNLGIDFKPGVSSTIQIDPSKAKTNIETLRKTLNGLEGQQVQTTGADAEQKYIVRSTVYKESSNYTKEFSTLLQAKLATSYGPGVAIVLSTTGVGAKFSATLTQQAFSLVGLSLLFIGIYVALRFRLGYAAGAMVATIHDTAFVIAFIGVTQMEVTSSTIAAVLTIIGYSLNDTIVVFDRIRENEKTMSDQALGHIIDSSIWQTLSRTIVTSTTVFIAALSITVFTHGEIQDFGITLICGVVVGTYSSIFIASPILLEWRAAQSRRRKKKEAGGVLPAGAAVATQDEHTNDVTIVDADAIAEEVRRQRQEKKKF